MKPILLTTAFILLCLGRCVAWGREGHAIVGRIAMQYVSSATRDKIRAILGNTSIEDAADWMDEIRSDSRYDYMQSWHYINISRGKQFDYKAAMADDNVFHAINNAVLKLQQKGLNPEDQQLQVMILMHLVGDLHMPLHDSYEDKGGNKVDVWFKGRDMSLHRLWDEELIHEEHISYETVLAAARSVTSAQLKKEQTTAPGDWINEARSYLPVINDIGNGRISNAYAQKSKPIIEHQLAMAGIRLALMLDRVLSNSATPKAGPVAVAGPAPAAAVPARKEQDRNRAVPKYTAAEAANHIGEVANVCGKVVDAKIVGDDKILLDLDAPYPDNPVTVVARTRKQGNLRKIMRDYLRKTICVTSEITTHKGKANMELNLDEQ